MKWTFKDFEAIVIMLLSFGTFIAVLFVFRTLVTKEILAGVLYILTGSVITMVNSVFHYKMNERQQQKLAQQGSESSPS